jgi:hypothetical protein
LSRITKLKARRKDFVTVKIKLMKFITKPTVHKVVEFFKYKEDDGKNKDYCVQKSNTKGTKPLLISASYN